MADPRTDELEGPPTQMMRDPPALAARRVHRAGGPLRRYRPALIVLGALVAISVAVWLAAGREEALAPPPPVEAAAYAVLDGRTREIIAGREASTRRPVASLVKMMTAHLVLQAGGLEREVTVPPLALESDESNIRLRPGESQRRDVLLRAMMIVSAGDAADALATDLAGSPEAFVERMNGAAEELGLDDTRYANPSGVDRPEGESSARDAARLAFVLMQDPRFREIAVRREARLHGELFPATNGLIGSYPGADGVKTGFTDGAGWCVVASARRDGRRVYVAVLGAPSERARDRAARALLDWAFAAG